MDYLRQGREIKAIKNRPRKVAQRKTTKDIIPRKRGKTMLQEAIDNLLESETCLQTRIEIINELTDQLLDRHYISNIRVKLIKEGLSIASEYDLCPECGLDYEYRKGIKRCPSCGRRSDNE